MVSYEAFIANPVDELSRLFDRLGLSRQSIDFTSDVLRVGSRAMLIRRPDEPLSADLISPKVLLDTIAAIELEVPDCLPR